MAHYAFLDENNIVTEVITGVDEKELHITLQEINIVQTELRSAVIMLE